MSGAARGQRIGRRGETRVPSSGGTSRGTQRLSGKTKRALGWALALSSVGVAALFVTRGRGPEHAAADLEDQGPTPRTDFGPAAGSAPPSLLAAAGPDDLAKRVAAAMADWRNAILVRNAGPVIKLQAAFAEAPAMYVEALKTSAASDENERVRAFSTRELGKLRRVDPRAHLPRTAGRQEPVRSEECGRGARRAQCRERRPYGCPERARGASAPGSARPGRGSAGGCPRCAESDGVG